MMNRNESLKKAINTQEFDLIVIGGGATGMGCAVDAASRGLKTLLLEQQDFGKGTSSRSTKLIHGGLRYLQQGNIKLVKEALKERGLLCQNAPHLVGHRKFVIPLYHYYEGPFYGAGLKLYDALAGSLGLESSEFLSKDRTIKAIPQIKQEGLKGGLVYYDGQFDDARLLITLAHTAEDLGAICLNYIQVIDLIKENGLVCGVIAINSSTGESLSFRSKGVINATGVFADGIRRVDFPESSLMMAPSQGVHLVLDSTFLNQDSALLVPKTEDGRVLFMVPWYDKVLVGTTDTLKEHIELEPKPLDFEIDFILSESAKYLTKPPKREDVLSVFTGLRPLVRQQSKASKALSRDHVIEVSSSNLITVVGGKWTTYRKMAEDTIDHSFKILNLDSIASRTEHLKLHGYLKTKDPKDPLSNYGTDLEIIKQIAKENSEFEKLIHPKLPYTQAEVVFAVRFEKALHLEDVLSRRLRALLLDAQSTIECAPLVCKIMMKELGLGLEWFEKELQNFKLVAKNYCLNSTKRE